jgi:hypothetical protein
VRIARNIVAGLGSTFDGIHRTNGYHPLWMLIVAALLRLAGSSTAFFWAVQGLLLLCVLATYFAAERIFAAFAPAAGWLPKLLAAGLATSALTLVAGGMEVAVAIPLLASFAWYRLCRFSWVPRRAFLLGLAAAALVLARLDTAILIALMGTLDLAGASGVPGRLRLRCALSFLGGLLPVAAYLAWNQLAFHSLMPVSGRAKQMRFHHWPSGKAFSLALIGPPQRYAMVYPMLGLTLAGLALLLLRPALRRGERERGRLFCLISFLLFPFLYYFLLSLLSDWPVWPWYGYPLLGSGLAGAALVSEAIAAARPAERLRKALTAAALTALVLLWTVYAAVQWRNAVRPQKLGYSMYLGARDIAGFARSHPGVYAMGDRAGTPGFLLPDRLVQLEGLTMDAPYLENIRRQRPLLGVLCSYGVRYYIATNAVPRGACWEAVEPLAAGADAPHMRGLLCLPPEARFEHSGYTTLIFDLAAPAGCGR